MTKKGAHKRGATLGYMKWYDEWPFGENKNSPLSINSAVLRVSKKCNNGDNFKNFVLAEEKTTREMRKRKNGP